MPVIAAFPDPVRAYVRVETNWADTPAVEFVRVLRVDSVTEVCTPLRPYICFSGDYLTVSCGHAIFWDTEVPLDRQVYYITEGLDAPCISPDPGDPCVPCVPVTAQTPELTIGSDGKFRLKDPVRPCRDQVVPLCFDQVASVDCLPGSGIFFASMGAESFAANSLTLNPANAEFPIAMSRIRRSVASTLTLVTRTFTDRDALKLITKPGSPLLFQGPPQYGIPDVYMNVGEVDYERGLTDHRVQTRVVDMPFVATARPPGPTQGVCGSRVGDLCDTYPTWQDMQDAGLTWDDLVRGRAGQPDPTDGFRTWDDVLAEFADWDDVNDGTRTWTDLEMGN